MSEAEFESLRERQGVHSFALTMNTAPLHSATNEDLWLRCIIGVLTTISVAGTGVAWRTMRKTADLQIRLVRASELSHELPPPSHGAMRLHFVNAENLRD